MAKREIKFSLVYRDMWQSSGKYVPRVDQLVEVAPPIIEMGCFDRVETNGGAFEQVNLLFGENPNKAVRAWTAPFHKAGIQTHMLERGLNALRMNPVPLDVRELMFKVKKKQGTDIARSFCGLNDHRNLKGSVIGAKKGGMISQVALSITHSPVHTVAYYMDIVDKVVEYGADEICLKDMAGIGRPNVLGELVASIKKKYPQVVTHCDCVQGFMKIPFTVKKLGADLISLSGHKIYAPKGVGALYVKSGVHIPPFMLGGGQEKGFRSGTESVPLICGFGAAVRALSGKVEINLERARGVQAHLIKKRAENGGIAVNFAHGSPYITSISVEGLKSEVLLHFLEKKGIFVSSGSACSKGKKSSVIKEFRVPEKLSDSVLRISISAATTNEDIDALIGAIGEAQGSLARIKK